LSVYICNQVQFFLSLLISLLQRTLAPERQNIDKTLNVVWVYITWFILSGLIW